MPSNRFQAIAFVFLIALAALAAALLLAACGGSSPPSGAGGSGADNALKFSKCMRENGVTNFPDPEVGPGGVTKLKFDARGIDRKTLETAQNACAHLQEEGGPQEEVSPQEKVEREEQVQKFAKCMREHGIELEVSTSGGGVQIQAHPGTSGGGPNPESPAFQQAQEACQGLMPGPKGGPGGPSVHSSPGGGGGATFGVESRPAK